MDNRLIFLYLFLRVISEGETLWVVTSGPTVVPVQASRYGG